MAEKIAAEEQWLRSSILPDLLKNGKLLDSAEIKADDVKVNAIDIKYIGTEEAFMLTECYKAKVELEAAGKPTTCSLVVKKTPKLPDEMFDAINFKILFGNEMFTYNDILPAFETFTKPAAPLTVPRYYYGDLQRRSATVILGDFVATGYQMSKDLYNLSVEHALLAVRYLGRFHGIGFALKHTNREKFLELQKGLVESRYVDAEQPKAYSDMLKFCMQRVPEATEKYRPDVDKAFVQKLYDVIKDAKSYGKQRVQPVEPIATLCHGDYLRNNIAYKYVEEKPVDVIMFDLQTMRYASPLIDVCTFLSVSTLHEVRWANLEQIMKAYCDTLSETFKEYAKEPLPEFLSYESIFREYAKCLPYSIGICSSFLMNMVEPKKFSVDDPAMWAQTEEQIKEDMLSRGGELVDREIASQVWELHEICNKYKQDFAEGIQYTSN